MIKPASCDNVNGCVLGDSEMMVVRFIVADFDFVRRSDLWCPVTVSWRCLIGSSFVSERVRPYTVQLYFENQLLRFLQLS